MSELSKPSEAQPSKERAAGRDYFERVAGNVYTGTVIVHRDGREIRLPRQVPPPVQHFKDRIHELERLLQDLQPGQVVTLCGPGGIGKTALVSEAIHSMLDMPDAVLLVHRDIIDDPLAGVLAGYLVHSGLIEDPIIATAAIQEILKRPLGPAARAIIPPRSTV